jgi:uncharacterized protein (DUF1330 family)
LKLDRELPGLGAILGKGFILPAPVLPVERFRSLVLPTPMSTVQAHLPVKLLIYDAKGRKAAEHSFGNLKRKEKESMAAYFIAQYVVNDPKLYREYQVAAMPTIQASGGELVAFDVAAETIEGTPPGPQTVILKFESTEAAKAWYQSPAYQAAVGKRLAATQGFAIISQSMNMGRR